jgi:hypothetical protein
VFRCIRRGVDIETLHADVAPDLELFRGLAAEADGARQAARVLQMPVYAGLTRAQVERVASTMRTAITGVHGTDS